MKNKGFTLVELLAVVGLIAAFALVTVPTVDSLLKRQRENIYNAHKKTITEALKTWGNMNIELLPDEDQQSISVTLLNLKEAGLVEDDITNPKTKKCYANSNLFTITMEKESYIYTVNDLIDGDSTDCEIGIPVYANGTMVYYNPFTKSTCNNYHEDNSLADFKGKTIDSTTANQTDCLKWYIFNDNENNSTVNIILDHNTSASTTFNSANANSSDYGPEISGPLNTLTTYWDTEVRIITAPEVAEIVGKSYDNAKFFFDSKTSTASPNCTTGNITGCDYGWLYDRTSQTCKSTGCNNNSDVAMEGYWTSTIHNGTAKWGVRYDGSLTINYATNRVKYGIRPVITINKSLIGG